MALALTQGETMFTIIENAVIEVTLTKKEALIVQAALQRFSGLRDEAPAERRMAVEMANQLYHETEALY